MKLSEVNERRPELRHARKSRNLRKKRRLPISVVRKALPSLSNAPVLEKSKRRMRVSAVSDGVGSTPSGRASRPRPAGPPPKSRRS